MDFGRVNLLPGVNNGLHSAPSGETRSSSLMEREFQPEDKVIALVKRESEQALRQIL
jgi:hypothetical protein